MNRLTNFDESSNEYVFTTTLTSCTIKKIKSNTDVLFDLSGEVIDKLATFENIMDEFHIESFNDLEQIIRREKNDERKKQNN